MKKGHVILLLAIIILASFLRFYNLDNKGIFIHDEGFYLQEAKFIVSGIKFLAGNFTKIVNHEISLDNCFKGDEIDLEGWPPMTAKIGHNILTALSMFIFQDKAFAGFFVSALFGVLTVILIFFMGKKMFNLRTAFFSSAILAVSGYHVFFSRTAFAETDSVFFFILAIYFYYLSKTNKKRNNFFLIIAGLSSGYAVLSNWRWLIIPAGFLLYELCYFEYVRVKRKMLITGNPGRIFLFFIAFFVPIIGCQLIYHIFLPTSSTFPSYFGQIVMRIIKYHGWINFKDFFMYFKFIYKLDGIAMLILISFGCFLMGKNMIGDLRQLKLKESIYKKKTLYVGGAFLEKHLVIITFLLLFTFWSFYSQGVKLPRTIIIVVPLYALIVGWTIDQFFCLIKNRKILKKFGILGVISIISFMFLHVYESLYLKSGYKEAMNFFKNKNSKKHISTFSPISQFYVGKKNAVLHLRGMSKLKEHYLNGYRYIVFDWTKYSWLEEYKKIKSIEENFKPVFVVDNMIGNNAIMLCENGYSREFVREHINDKDLTLIKIYDLEEVFKNK